MGPTRCSCPQRAGGTNEWHVSLVFAAVQRMTGRHCTQKHRVDVQQSCMFPVTSLVLVGSDPKKAVSPHTKGADGVSSRSVGRGGVRGRVPSPQTPHSPHPPRSVRSRHSPPPRLVPRQPQYSPERRLRPCDRHAEGGALLGLCLGGAPCQSLRPARALFSCPCISPAPLCMHLSMRPRFCIGVSRGVYMCQH
jgi:hypothetical protein